MAQPEPLLRLENVEVVYHQVSTAIQGVSLEVRTGQVVALLGTNGAGKTTTLRGCSGFIGLDDARVTEGAITFKNKRIDNQPPHAITALGVALVPERDKVFDALSVAENLEVSMRRRSARGDRRNGHERAYSYFPRLAELRDRQAGYLSGGERQMLTIAAALMCQPDLLMIDELSLGLAPKIVDELVETIGTIRREEGMTVLLVEQNAVVALEIADYGYVIENGRIVLDGEPGRLLAHQDIQEFYLGGGSDRRSYRDVKQYRRSRRWYG